MFNRIIKNYNLNLTLRKSLADNYNFNIDDNNSIEGIENKFYLKTDIESGNLEEILNNIDYIIIYLYHPMTIY